MPGSLANLNASSALGFWGGSARPGSGEDLDCFIDGDYTDAEPSGLMVPEFPYIDEGNTAICIFRQPHEQYLETYQPPNLTLRIGGTVAGAPIHVLGDHNFRDAGAGVLSFERFFARIPARRVRRGQSFRYPFQFVLLNGAFIPVNLAPAFSVVFGGSGYTIGSEPMTVDSILQYDFFLAGREDDFPLQRAPRLFQAGDRIRSRGVSVEQFGPNQVFPLYLKGSCVCSDEDYILAEDDTYAHWRGAIKYRLRRLIAGPTPEFWDAQTN